MFSRTELIRVNVKIITYNYIMYWPLRHKLKGVGNVYIKNDKQIKVNARGAHSAAVALRSADGRSDT